MSVKVHVVERRVMAGEHEGQYRFYGRLKARGKVLFEQLCEKIMHQSTTSQGEVELVLHSLLVIIREQLLMGNVVQLGDLGNMRISVGSRGADTKELFHVSMMKKPRLLFVPGRRLKEMLRDVTYDRQETKTVIQEVIQQPGPPDDED